MTRNATPLKAQNATQMHPRMLEKHMLTLRLHNTMQSRKPIQRPHLVILQVIIELKDVYFVHSIFYEFTLP